MKSTLIIFLAVVILAPVKGNAKDFPLIFASDTNDVKIKMFGTTAISLPNIAGMIESIDEKDVYEISELVNFPGNRNLGFYLSEKDYKELRSEGDKEFEDFLRVYVNDDLKNITYSNEDLEKIDSIIKSGFVQKNWNNLYPQLQINMKDYRWDKPILIDSYRHSEKVFTHVFFMKLLMNNTEYYYLCAGNIVLIKSRPVWIAYYNLYNDEDTLSLLKKRNDFYIFRILEVN